MAPGVEQDLKILLFLVKLQERLAEVGSPVSMAVFLWNTHPTHFPNPVGVGSSLSHVLRSPTSATTQLLS
jgi:hypothetical protein